MGEAIILLLGQEKMILLPHMLVGAAIGSKVKNLGVVFVISTLLHFLFDRLPHFEYLQEKKFRNMSLRDLTILFISALIDMTAGLLLIWGLLKDSLYSPSVIGGIFFSILPDGLVFFHAGMQAIFHKEIRILKGFFQFHDYMHISNNKHSFISGLVIEGLIAALAMTLIVCPF